MVSADGGGDEGGDGDGGRGGGGGATTLVAYALRRRTKPECEKQSCRLSGPTPRGLLVFRNDLQKCIAIR